MVTHCVRRRQENPVWGLRVPAVIAATSIFFLLFRMDLKNNATSREKSSDCCPETSVHLDRADLEELIGSVVRREIASHLL